MKSILLLIALMAAGCGVFGTPSPKTNQCFDWCLDVPVAGETVAMCYGSQAEMLAAQASLQGAGVKASIRK